MSKEEGSSFGKIETKSVVGAVQSKYYADYISKYLVNNLMQRETVAQNQQIDISELAKIEQMSTPDASRFNLIQQLRLESPIKDWVKLAEKEKGNALIYLMEMADAVVSDPDTPQYRT